MVRRHDEKDTMFTALNVHFSCKKKGNTSPSPGCSFIFGVEALMHLSPPALVTNNRAALDAQQESGEPLHDPVDRVEMTL